MMSYSYKVETANDLAELLELMSSFRCNGGAECGTLAKCATCEINRTTEEFLGFMEANFTTASEALLAEGLIYSTLDGEGPYTIVDEGDPYDYYE